jgi:putative tricarboxylic transport membrane protein
LLSVLIHLSRPALLGGHVDVMNGGTVQIAPHVESGKMRVLAVTSPQRLPGPLSVGPTWTELGFKGTFLNWRGVIGTRGMTPEQIAFWDNVFRRVVESGEFKKLAEKNQWDANFKSAAETRRFMESEYNELKEVMTFLGLVK